MYSKKAWGGDVEPYIMARFDHAAVRDDEDTDPVVAVAIFNWNDVNYIGSSAPEAPDKVGIQYVWHGYTYSDSGVDLRNMRQ